MKLIVRCNTCIRCHFMGVHTVTHILIKIHMNVFKDVNTPLTKFSLNTHCLKVWSEVRPQSLSINIHFNYCLMIPFANNLDPKQA